MNGFWQAIASLLAKIAALLTAAGYGQERQKRKQAEADAETLAEYQDVDARPDVDSPFERLRGE